MPSSAGTTARASTVKKSSLPVSKAGMARAHAKGSAPPPSVPSGSVAKGTADSTVRTVDVMARSFPTFTLAPSSTSRGYTVSNVRLNNSFKFILDNVLLRTVTEERKEGYGSEFITIGIPQQFANHLVGDLDAEFHRPIENQGYHWFNITIVGDFGGFEAKGGNEIIMVDMESFALDSGEAINARILVNAYVSRSGRGGNPFIRVKLHHAQIKGSSSVLPPDPRTLKSFTRLPPSTESTDDTLFAAFAVLNLDETEEEEEEEEVEIRF